MFGMLGQAKVAWDLQQQHLQARAMAMGQGRQAGYAQALDPFRREEQAGLGRPMSPPTEQYDNEKLLLLTDEE